MREQPLVSLQYTLPGEEQPELAPESCSLVRRKGLEPPRRKALEPKSSASTNSATLAVFRRDSTPHRAVHLQTHAARLIMFGKTADILLHAPLYCQPKLLKPFGIYGFWQATRI